jgi:hypothetical protein
VAVQFVSAPEASAKLEDVQLSKLQRTKIRSPALGAAEVPIDMTALLPSRTCATEVTSTGSSAVSWTIIRLGTP